LKAPSGILASKLTTP